MVAPVDLIMAYEAGELDAHGTLDLFAQLIKSGLAWKLQGSYGRTATTLIARGAIDKLGRISPDFLERLEA